MLMLFFLVMLVDFPMLAYYFWLMPRGETMYDAILLPGGDLGPDGKLAPRNYPRIDTAERLYKSGMAHHIIASGGHQSFGLEDIVAIADPEAFQLEEELIGRGIPRSAIITDPLPRETIGCAIGTKEIMLENGWDSVISATSKSHGRRMTKALRFACGPGFTIDRADAPERFWRIKRTRSIWGALTMRYVFQGIDPGDHEAVKQSLEERVPSYGPAEYRNFRIKSLTNFLLHPLAVTK